MSIYQSKTYAEEEVRYALDHYLADWLVNEIMTSLEKQRIIREDEDTEE